MAFAEFQWSSIGNRHAVLCLATTVLIVGKLLIYRDRHYLR